MIPIRRLFLVLLFLFLTFILLPSERVGANFGPSSAIQNTLDIIAEINTLRATRNLAPYQANPILMNIAQAQANHMAETGVVTHFDENGARPFQRAIAAGYPVAGDLSNGGLFSENIHYGANLTPSQLVDVWQVDSDNMQAMISPELKDVGVGIAIANGQTYYVMDAGASTEETMITATPGSALLNTSTPGTQLPPILISTALENGDVYHEVRASEALWSIALAYNTSIDEIKLLNGLATDEIVAGQRLLVKRSGLFTPTLKPVVTATFGIPTSTATILAAPTITATPTPMPVPPGSLQTGIMVVSMIVILALVAAGVGSWVGRKK